MITYTIRAGTVVIGRVQQISQRDYGWQRIWRDPPNVWYGQHKTLRSAARALEAELGLAHDRIYAMYMATKDHGLKATKEQ